MENRDIIKRPVITERSSEQMAQDKYTFDVDTRANKTQIKIAIEEIFNVKVDKDGAYYIPQKDLTAVDDALFPEDAL